MKTESLKSLSDNDIVVRRSELMRDLMVTQFQLRTGQLEDSSRLKKFRRSLAKLNTELRARELASGLEKGVLVNRTVSRVAEQPGQGSETAPAPKRSRFGLGFIRDTLLGRRS